MAGPYPRSCPAYQLLVFWVSHCHKALSCTWQSQNLNPGALMVEHKALLSCFCARLYPLLIYSNINEVEMCGINSSQRSYINSDQVNSYVRTHKWRPPHVAHISNLNLSQPTLTENTCQGHQTYTNHSHPTQLQLAHLTLENRTCRPYKEIPNLLASHALFLGCLF